MITYFKNLIVELHILYIFKTYVKFHANRMLKLLYDNLIISVISYISFKILV